MGRWRPPQPRSSKYITAEGYARLNEELKYLWKVKRPEITQSEDENERTHRIVGPDEIGIEADFISIDSPLARLILKKQLGDEICLKKPDGSEVYYEIVGIRYTP